MEKTLKLSLAEYEQLITDKNDLKKEVERLNSLLKEEGRVIDLKFVDVRGVKTDYYTLDRYKYPFYQSVKLTDTEKVVNELVLGMRTAMEDNVKTLQQMQETLSRSEGEVSMLKNRIERLKSRNWFQRLFNY